MERGLLWFDDDPKIDLNEKVRQAADHYRKKFGRIPDLCFVNPSALNNELITDQKIAIRPYRSILPGHLWIGISEASAN